MPAPAPFSTGHQAPLAAIASHHIAHLPPASTLLQAARLMASQRISSLLILDDAKQALGILSELDLLAALHNATPPQTPLAEVMAPPVTVPATMDCAEAYQRCLHEGVQHLVLVDAQQRAVAVVSDTDYRRCLDMQAPAAQTRIGAIMSRAVAIFPPETPLDTALAQMHTRMCGVVIVVNGQQMPVGILSQRDLARLYVDEVQSDARQLAEVMTSPVRTLPMDATLAQAAEAMLTQQVRQYPVVDAAGRLMGLIAARDLTQAMAFGMVDASLTREQSQLQHLLEQAPFPLLISRIESGLVCYLNKRAERHFHLCREQLLGQSTARFYQHPEDRVSLVAQLQRDGQVIDQELALLDIDGHPYTALVSLSLVEFEQQPAILTAINDITQRKQFEQDLIFRNILLSTQQQASIDGILVVDDLHRILSTNRRFQEMWHVPTDLLEQRQDNQLLHHALSQVVEPEAFLQRVRSLYQRRHQTARDAIALTDGRVLDRYTAPLLGEDQHYYGRVWFFRDITEQQQAAHRLQQERAKLHGLIQAIPDLLWLKDAQGRYLLCNPIFERFIGKRESEILGKTDHDFFPTEQADFFRDNDQRAIAAGGPRSNEEWLHFADGSREGLFEAVKTPLVDEDGTLIGVLGIARDITQRRREQRDLRERVKEQRCLYRIFALTEDVRLPLARQLQQVVDEIPLGWQYPEIAKARLLVDGILSFTAGFAETAWMQHVAATTRQGSELHLSIAYLEQRPEEEEGPFLSEERGLAEAIIHRLAEVMERRHALAEVEARDRLITTMYAQSTDSIVLVDVASQRFVDFNTIAHTALGYSAEEFTRLRVQDIQATLSPEQILAEHTTVLRGRALSHETKHRHKDGSLRDVALTLRPLILQGRQLISAVWQDITEQKARERALQDSQLRLKAITDSALDAILMMDNQGNLSYWNPAAERMLGYTAEEVLGQNLHLLIAPPRFHGEHRQAFAQFLRHGSGGLIGKTIELAALCKNGQEIIISLSLSSVRLNNAWHAVGVLRDISAWKQQQKALEKALAAAETANRAKGEVLAHLEELVQDRTAELDAVNEQLRNSEERYTLALEATSDGLWDWDMSSGAFYCSPAYYRMLGYEPGERAPNQQASGFELIHPEDRHLMQATFERLLAGEDVLELEFRMLAKTGAIVWVLSRGRVVERTAEGLPIRAVGIHTDLTSRKQVETALLLAAEEQQAIFNAAGMGIFLVKNRVIVRCNRRLEEVFGYAPQELIGVTTERWYTSRAEFLQKGQIIADTLRSDGLYHAELQMRRKDGSLFWVRTTAQALDRHDLAKGIVGMLDDITQERLASEALHRAKEAAESATRAKSEFLANMSHEIRTPLNAILGFAHLLRRDPLTLRQQGQLDKLTDASRHLLQVINNILDISKIEANKMTIDIDDFEPARVIEQVCSMLSDKVADKQLQLHIDIAQLPPMLRGDGPRLGQILLNLLGNAVKFTQEGRVNLSVHLLEQRADQVLLRFAVQDTGIGMNQEQMARLFRAFEQADSSTTRSFGGSGLGLAICKRLVEIMAGRIGVDSQLGQGSRFWVDLPFAPSLRLPQARMQGESLRGKRALLIDDSPESREIMVAMLEDIGLEVVAVNSGEEGLGAVQTADRSGTPFALLVVDWCLGGIDGITTVERLQALELAHHPALLMVTAYSDDLPRIQALGAGISRVITKPVTPSMLFDAIVEIMLPTVTGQETAETRASTLHQCRGAHILVVEDNLVNQEVAQMLLESMGMRVCVADNGQVAVDRVAQESFDLVFMDMQMPVMDGLQAAAAIRRLPHRQSLPILAMTANAFSEDREHCLAAGMNDHIAKPIDLDKLQTLLLKWLPQRLAVPAPDGDSTITAPSGIDALRSLDGLDIEAGLRLLQGDGEGYMRLLLQFAEQHGGDADHLVALVQAGDLPGLRQHSHALKGAAATLGAWQIAQLAADIEQMSGAAPAAEALRPSIEALRPQLEQLRHRLATAPLPLTSTVPPLHDQAQVLALLRRMEQLLAIEDSAVNDLFLSHRRQLAAAFAAQVPRLGRLIDAFDYAEALGLVRDLLATQMH